MVATGIWDDIRSLNASGKFAGQILAASVAYTAGVRIDGIDVPFVGPVDCGWLGPAITILWIVGVTNAINLIDGLDGLSAGLCAIAAVGMILLFGVQGTHFEIVAAALAGSCVGFLFYNFHPAKVFMGDAGSLGLGFLLACLAVTSSHKQSTATMLALPLVLLAIPVVDSCVCFLRRIANGRSPFTGDLGHVHHILLSLGWSQRRVVLSLYAVSALFTAAAVAAGELRHEVAVAVLPAAVLIAAFLFYRAHGVLTVREIMIGRRIQRIVDIAARRFREGNGADDQLGRAARLMGLSLLVLRRAKAVGSPASEETQVVYRYGSSTGPSLVWQIDEHYQAEIGAPTDGRSHRLFGCRLTLAPLMKAAANRAAEAGSTRPPSAASSAGLVVSSGPENGSVREKDVSSGSILLTDTSLGRSLG